MQKAYTDAEMPHRVPGGYAEKLEVKQKLRNKELKVRDQKGSHFRGGSGVMRSIERSGQ